MSDEDKAGIKTEREGTPGKDGADSAEEIHIPDYTMLDFGLLGRARRYPEE